MQPWRREACTAPAVYTCDVMEDATRLRVGCERLELIAPHCLHFKVPTPFLDLMLLEQDGGKSWSVLKEDYMMGASSMKVRWLCLVLS